jgi:hypothetical protein
MPGLKYVSIFRGVEWRNYTIAKEFEQLNLSWVGSIPTRSRHSKYKASLVLCPRSLLLFQPIVWCRGKIFVDILRKKKIAKE